MDCLNHDNYFTKKCIENRELESIREKSDGITVILTFFIMFFSYLYSLFNN